MRSVEKSRPVIGRNRLVFRILSAVFVVVFAAACTLPTLDIGSGTPQPEATGSLQTVEATQVSGPGGIAPTTQTTPLPPLPPALVEVSPMPESELAPGTAPVFYFNQPMEPASVEAALRTEPEIPGSVQWIDAATMRFQPDPLQAAPSDVRITIGEGARSADGQALVQPVAVQYRAPGPLRIIERLPAPDSTDVSPSSAVVVTFNRPVAPLGGESDFPPAFTIETGEGLPAPAGRGEWINTSTYIFYPEPALYGGAQYTVTANAGLVSTDGSPLGVETASDQTGLSWSFTTAQPALMEVQPNAGRRAALDETFRLTFNQPMDPASVQENFSLLDAAGAPVAGSFSWNDTLTEVEFRPSALLARDANYSLMLFGSAQAQGGAPLSVDTAVTISTVPGFGVTRTEPAAGELLPIYFAYGSVQLIFSSPIAAGQDLNRLVSISPEIVDFRPSRSVDGYSLFVTGYFKHSTSYTLTVSSDLRDRWEAVLGAPYTFTFSTIPAEPSLIIPSRQAGNGAIFIPQGETVIPARSTNIDFLDLSLGSLSLGEFVGAVGSWEGLQNWEGKTQSMWERPVYTARNVAEPIDIPTTPDGSPLPTGLYFLNISTSPNPGYEMSPSLLVVSPIQLTLKVSARQAFVWAVRVSDRTPVSGLPVSIYQGSEQVIAICTTDEQGICQAELPETEDTESDYTAVSGKPGDPNFSLVTSSWHSSLAPWDFQLSYERERSAPKVYLYSDRPIYRPGQAVHFRAVVRGKDNARYSLPEMDEITVEVVNLFDPLIATSQTLTTLRLPLTEYGTASGVYTLPDDVRPGSYMLRIPDFDFQELYFQVAEYRKPEIDLQVKFSAPDRLAGEDSTAVVTAKYFFGAPAGSLPVRWTLFSTSSQPHLPDGLSAGKMNMYWLDTSFNPFVDFYITEGQGVTGPDGTLTITVPGSQVRDRLGSRGEQMQILKLEATVEDEAGLPVSGRDTQRLHPSPFYAGLRSEQWSVAAGEEITYSIRTVDWKGSPVGGKKLTASFRKVTWREQESEDPYVPPNNTPVYTDAGSTEFVTSDQGEARIAFLPAEPGTFLMEVTGEGGVVSQDLIWVSGEGSAAWPEMPNQRTLLRADADSYKPGDTAKIFIPNPFDRQTLALITIERGKVMRSFVQMIEGASSEFSLPILDEDAPNIYVSVQLLGETDSRPDFRVGYLELLVDPAARLLDVAVETSPAQAQPGEEVTVNIRVRDAAGKPVQGEFSLAFVDKAVLALANPNSQPITEAFYGPQRLGVATGYALSAYSGRALYSPPGRGGGGGGADSGASAGLREKFEDTAFWSGAVVTDVTGVAQVTLTLPDNLTTWQADVRGVTEDTLVGQARVDLVTSKPLLIRPVTPRFAVPGDHIAMVGVVHNNTDGAVRASARLEGAGFTLDDLNLTVQAVDIAAGGRAEVTWWGVVQDVDALELTFSAESGGLRDSARPEIGAIPVVRFTAPQTFGTSGVIPEAGERLEIVSLPRSFTPSGGSLRLELSPSLSAAVLDGLRALDSFPRDYSEAILSRLLPNLATLEAFREFGLQDEALRSELEEAVTDSVDRLARLQNEDGGWGWAAGYLSDPYISTYVMLGMSRASKAGVFVSADLLQKGRDYLLGQLHEPTMDMEGWLLDQLAFRYYSLGQAGQAGLDPNALYELREKLSPWGTAFLAMAIEDQSQGDERARTLISDLEGAASRTATGASWHDPNPSWHSWSSGGFTTAVAAFAVARLDPQSPLLLDAVRYLVLNRRAEGGWHSSYETAWALMALIETVRGTGDLQADYSYSAALNGSPMITGDVAGQAQALMPVNSLLPISAMRADAPNGLMIRRGEGTGRLFYRAYLEVSRPAEDAPAINRGLSITRQYYRSGQDCRAEDCAPIDTVDLGSSEPVLVRLTLTVPEDMYYVIVEDNIPAGAEVLNPRLRTSQQNFLPSDTGEEEEPLYDPANPFSSGWGWWLFNNPQVYDDRVRWVVEHLPAGSYELTYRLTPYLAGEFRLIPAHAWQMYFPEVEGTSTGGVLTFE